MDKPEKLLYNTAELKALFGMNKNLIYDLIALNSFPKITINGRYYFPVDAVKKWVSQNTGKSIEC